MPEPVSLELARTHLRLDDQDDDNVVEQLLAAAQGWVEEYTGVLLSEREVTQTFDRFGLLELSGWPLASDATIELTYLDTNGVAQTQPGYRLIGGRPARLLPTIGESWPTVYYDKGVVTATYTAGYDDPDKVPAPLKQAILVLLTAFYENRSELPEGVEKAAMSLCRPYRMPVIG